MSARAKYTGDAGVTPAGKQVRVWIEAPNVRAEVYISRERARAIYEHLAVVLGAAAGSEGAEA